MDELREDRDLHRFDAPEDLPCFEEQDLGPCASRSPEIGDCRDIVAKQGDRLASEELAEPQEVVLHCHHLPEVYG